jgi:serine/threonine protein kinase
LLVIKSLILLGNDIYLFIDANLTALYDSILKGKYEIPDYLSSGNSWFIMIECKDFIARLIVLNPKKRWSCAQLKAHSWLSDGIIFQNSDDPETENCYKRPTNEDEMDQDILDQMEHLGFEKKTTIDAVLGTLLFSFNRVKI